MGLVFAVGAAAVMAIDGLLDAIGNGRRRRAAVAVLLLVCAAPIVVDQTWQARIARLQFQKAFEVSWTAGRLAALVSPSRRTGQEPLTVRSFRRALDLAPVGKFGNGTIVQGRWTGTGVDANDLPRPASTRHWFFALLAASALALLSHWHDRRRTHFVVHTALAAGGVAYLTLLLYVFLFAFGAYQGPRVLSFGRYAGTWFLGWALVILASFGSVTLQSRWRHTTAAVLIAAAIGWCVIRTRAQPAPAVIYARTAVQSIVGSAEPSLPPSARTYVVWQGTEGLEFHLIAYELTPRPTNTWCWSLGEKFADRAVWTCPISPEAWAKELVAYDYVLIGHADEQFWTTYQALFAVEPGQPPPRGRLFKVERVDSSVTLRQVGTRP
jgi:hypothetical protein